MLRNKLFKDLQEILQREVLTSGLNLPKAMVVWGRSCCPGDGQCYTPLQGREGRPRKLQTCSLTLVPGKITDYCSASALSTVERLLEGGKKLLSGIDNVSSRRLCL